MARRLTKARRRVLRSVYTPKEYIRTQVRGPPAYLYDKRVTPSPGTARNLTLQPSCPSNTASEFDACTICLDDHDRAACPLLVTEESLRLVQAELSRLREAYEDWLPCQAAPKHNPSRQSRYDLRSKQLAILDPDDYTSYCFDTAEGVENHKRRIELYQLCVDYLHKTRKTTHENLCQNRCRHFHHDDGACAQTSIDAFEMVHTLELERDAARRRKAKGKMACCKLDAWKPKKTLVPDFDLFYKGGWDLHSLMYMPWFYYEHDSFREADPCPSSWGWWTGEDDGKSFLIEEDIDVREDLGMAFGKLITVAKVKKRVKNGEWSHTVADDWERGHYSPVDVGPYLT